MTSKSLAIGVWLALVAMLALAAPVAAVNGPARVTVEPTNLLGEFKFDVRGFFREEGLSTWLTGPSQQIVRTDDYATTDSGRTDFKLFMLRHYQPGTWSLTTVGQRSGKEVITEFENPNRGHNADVAMSATTLRIGDTVTVTGAGFGKEETVSYWYTLPDGSAARGSTTITADNLGTVSFTITVMSGDLEPGGWALSVYGNRSDAYGVATFQIVE